MYEFHKSNIYFTCMSTSCHGKENGSKAFIIRSQMLIQSFLLNNRNKFRNTMINYKSLLHRAIRNDHLSNENQKF